MFNPFLPACCGKHLVPRDRDNDLVTVYLVAIWTSLPFLLALGSVHQNLGDGCGSCHMSQVWIKASFLTNSRALWK
jgi:hypothetical protein